MRLFYIATFLLLLTPSIFADNLSGEYPIHSYVIPNTSSSEEIMIDGYEFRVVCIDGNKYIQTYNGSITQMKVSLYNNGIPTGKYRFLLCPIEKTKDLINWENKQK